MNFTITDKGTGNIFAVESQENIYGAIASIAARLIETHRQELGEIENITIGLITGGSLEIAVIGSGCDVKVQVESIK